MSGGGVTPFSPTPWIFDTGTTPQTMGLNCVAGTTEYDEDEGIGLVLYVNSESNLIVWKISDGTKQGTVVPLTTDYQSMLKSEFENKTGIAISYIVIHTYTEDTIDIESSITINSGDTPEQKTLVAIANSSSGSPVYCGVIRGTQINFFCAESDAPHVLIVTYPDGIIRSYQGNIINEREFNNVIKQQLMREGITVETFGTETPEGDITINNVMLEWDKYIYVPW